MKKFSSIIISLLLVVLFCAGAFADAVNVEIDYEGEYVTFDDTFSLYLPDSFIDSELTDDMEQSGIFALYTTENNDVAMSVQWILPDNGSDLEAIGSGLSNDSNYSNVSMMTFNSIPFLVYDTTGAFGCMCADGSEDGGFYVFSFAPDNADTSTLALKIMASIQ